MKETPPAPAPLNPKKQERVFRRLLGLAWEYKSDVVVTFFLQALTVVFTVLILSLVGYAIDTLRHLADPETPAAGSFFGWTPASTIPEKAQLWLMGGIIFVLAALRLMSQVGANWMQARLSGLKIVPALRARIYQKLQRLSFRFFDTNSSSSLINRVTGDVQLVRAFIDEGLIRTMILVATLCIYLVYMFQIHVGLTLACMAGTPIMLLCSIAFSRLVRKKHLENRALMDRLIQLVTDSVRGVRTLKGFSIEEDACGEFASRNRHVRDQKTGIFTLTSGFSAIMDGLTYLNIAILLGYGGWLVLNEVISLGKGLVVFAGLLQQFTAQLAMVTQIVNRLQESLVGATRVFEIMDAPVEVTDRPDAVPAANLRGEVEFRDVSFKHAHSEKEAVLKNLSFRCHSGMRVAILGATGSGKSALMNLIPRFYDASSGQVCIDGRDVREYQLRSLRRQIGMVFQESFLFQGSISENISFGHPDATTEEIQRAASLSGAFEFIDQLPARWDTPLREGGNNLSGGQRQRLAIARALITNPTILLLDDPTASLDAETDAEVQSSLETAMRGRTTFIVAHRISTLQRADLILVLERGMLVQSGTHEELLRQRGLYLSVARAQLERPTAFRRGGPRR